MDGRLPILVVDDSLTMARILRHLLAQIGFGNVDTAANAATALAKLRDRRYGLVLAAARGGTHDGLGLLRAIRADAVLVALPFVLITTGDGGDDVRAAQRDGLDGHLVRPFSADSLRVEIAAVLRRWARPRAPHAAQPAS